MRIKISLISLFLFTLVFGLLLPKTALAASFTLSGNVSDSSGHPVANTSIVIHETNIVGTTDSSGNYSVSVPQNTYNITAIPPSSSGLQSSDVSDESIFGDTVLNFTLVPAVTIVNYTFSGHITDKNGVGIGGLPMITCGDNSCMSVTQRGQTDSNGFYSFQAPSGSHFYLGFNHIQSATLPHFVEVVLSTAFTLSQDTTFDVQISTISVTFHVKDQLNNPVANAPVDLRPAPGCGCAFTVHTSLGDQQINVTSDQGQDSSGFMDMMGTTDNSGNVTLEYFPLINTSVAISPPNYSGFSENETFTGNNTQVITLQNLSNFLVTAINPGGETQGNFVADTDFSGGTPYSSSASVDISGVSNPAPQGVYQSVRYGNFSYSIPNLTANSSYTVKLHFNEIYWGSGLSGNSGGEGSRVFNVAINGSQVLNNFDIFSAAGGANKAVVEQFPAIADANGNIAIQFTSVTDNAMVNGIEIYNGTLPPLPTPTPVSSLALSAGGPGSGNFVADSDYLGGGTFSSSASVDTSNVTNPAPESVYQNSRYGNFTYTIPTFNPNAAYQVRLHFDEPYWGSPLSGNNGGEGSRVFNVSINGTQVLNNFDVYQTAGGTNKAVVEQFNTTSDSVGFITIHFDTVADNAIISGIEISQQ